MLWQFSDVKGKTVRNEGNVDTNLFSRERRVPPTFTAGLSFLHDCTHCVGYPLLFSFTIVEAIASFALRCSSDEQSSAKRSLFSPWLFWRFLGGGKDNEVRYLWTQPL